MIEIFCTLVFSLPFTIYFKVKPNGLAKNSPEYGVIVVQTNENRDRVTSLLMLFTFFCHDRVGSLV